MTFISYSDNLEDVMLWRAFRDLDQGFYIDIRAGTHARGSVTQAFYEKGWCGLNVTTDSTANPARAKERPRDIHINCAVGSSDTDQVKTLASIWQACLSVDQSVHFLHIDALGTQKNVILGNDWTQFRPWVVVIRLRSPEREQDSSEVDSHEEWERLLLGHQYRFAYADGLSRFYVAEEHGELLQCFRHPPNVCDGYLAESHQRAESALAEATLRLQAIETKYQEVLRQALGAKFESDRAQAQQIELKAQLQAVHDSLSWRITSPVRNLQSFLRNLLGADWKSRLKSAIKKPIVYLAKKILSHRTAKSLVIRLAMRLGVYDRFRSLLSGQSFFDGQSSNEPYAPSLYWISTARSRRARSDLNAEVEKNRREST